MAKRYTLMIPGPVGVSREVLQQMGAPVVAHYGSDWAETYAETVGLLKQVFQTEDDVFILTGSGSSGLDAGIGGLLKRGEKVLIPDARANIKRIQVFLSDEERAAVVRSKLSKRKQRT